MNGKSLRQRGARSDAGALGSNRSARYLGGLGVLACSQSGIPLAIRGMLILDQRHMEVDEQSRTLAGQMEMRQKLFFVHRHNRLYPLNSYDDKVGHDQICPKSHLDPRPRVRALQPWGEDHRLLTAVNRGEILVHGFRDRDLQALLYAAPAATPVQRRRRSALISRQLRMLRAHGVIHKIPHTDRYQVAPEARTVLVAIVTTARTTLHQINQLKNEAVREMLA